MTDRKERRAKRKKEEAKKAAYGYSTKLSSTENQAASSTGAVKAEHIKANAGISKAVASKGASAPSTLSKEQQMQQYMQDLKQNPQAMQLLKHLVKEEQAKKFNIAQKAAAIARKVTVSNIQKTAKNSLKLMDNFISFITEKEGQGRNEIMQKTRYPILFGIWIIFITFFIGGIWAALAPLDKASHAQGFVVTDSKKQLIQHREGGILEKLYVKEGEEVEAGQLLVKLSDIATKSALDGLRAQKNSFEKQLQIVREQVEALEGLQKEGFVSRMNLIETQSKEAQIIGHLSDAESRIAEGEERLSRLSIVSPLSGIVNQIQIYTKGGTVPQGATLMTVTPKDDNLVIEAYISPNDIDSVYIGLKTKVRVSAFKHRSVAPLEGRVSFVSSDVFEPPQYYSTQEGILLQRGGLMYKVKIEIDKAQLKKISKYRDYELYPGMQADVTIVIGERTLLEYLLDPILTTFWYAMKEQ